MDKPKVEKFKENFVVTQDAIISTISRENFTRITRGELKQVIKENINSHEVRPAPNPSENSAPRERRRA
jgi:hypothetical protein